MDPVFRALADGTRRSLLDELLTRDGQTLTELEERLPMTRFGVMKHLRVLERAGLVTTRRRGREKLHFLNPEPICLIHGGWVSKYSRGSKRLVEGSAPGSHSLGQPGAYRDPSMVSVLLISGSSREGSTNMAVLRTAAARAPDNVTTRLYDGIGALPLFNPDDDREGAEVDARVATMRAAVGDADALLICTPEYAGAMPAALKNLLEWTIGDGGTYRKPTAWINAAGPAAPSGAADAHDSLRKVLAYAHADIVDDACARVPITRDMVGPDGLLDDGQAREQIAAALAVLADHVGAAASGTPARA